ncbi:MAG: hypothetical protein P4L84_37505 [Isosphaeraceae bacterium]|nr:hypothetical protein [Isosphaeraceae bacterium]
MTIHLPEDLERFLRTALDCGRFTSEDEAIAEAVRLLRERDQSPASAVARPVTEEEFRRHLLKIGLMSQVPEGGDGAEDADDEPIVIEGEPLSETVIRERR